VEDDGHIVHVVRVREERVRVRVVLAMSVSASMVITPCPTGRCSKRFAANVSRLHVYAPPAAPRALELGMHDRVRAAQGEALSARDELDEQASARARGRG